jgi:monoamine oxidase
MPRAAYDVAIIGAGAAGLAAADAVSARGRSVLVLEARDRIGGRVWTRTEPGLPVPIELGAEFIHGLPDVTVALLGRSGRVAVDAEGAFWTLREGSLELRSEMFPRIQAAMRDAAKSLATQDLSLDTFLARAARKGLAPDVRSYARMLVQGFDAADPKRVSARAIAEEWGEGGVLDQPQYRPLGGYGPLLDSLESAARSRGAQFLMQARVRVVRWKRRHVAIEAVTPGRVFRTIAERLIVTLPLGVLQLRASAPGAVRFSPPLDAKRPALRGLAAGPVLKLVLRFRSAFWESIDSGRYHGASFFLSPQATSFPTFWTAVPARAPVLVAWAGGPKVAQISRTDPGRVLAQALASLRALFRNKADPERELEAFYFHDWQQDPYARGAYSYVVVGGANARKALAEPLLDTLFFAGEATDTQDEAATVAGALQTGIRAAREATDNRTPRRASNEGRDRRK